MRDWAGRVWRDVELWVDRIRSGLGEPSGFRKDGDSGGSPSPGELWVVRLGLVRTAQLPPWTSPLAPRSYLKLRLQGAEAEARC